MPSHSSSSVHTGAQERDSSLGPHIVLAIAAAAFLVQMIIATRYGIFRDELYYLDCARHLAWGYVDQPPLIAFLTWLEREHR
jgi:hypothetical protein